MGEAKRRNAIKKSAFEKLDEELKSFGINTGNFGFYDEPEFLQQEAIDPEFLNNYAAWVQSRPRSDEYDARARTIVPQLSRFLADLFENENMQRSCVHASSMIPRILDRMGIWSFGLKGSFVAEVKSANLWRGQATCDYPAFEGAELGHAWVVAPPFVIVDATVRLQNPSGDAMNLHLPDMVAVEDAPLTKPTVDDVVSASVQSDFARREGRDDSQLHHRLEPGLREFGREFPSRQLSVGDLTLRYVPAGVRLSDIPLEDINGEAEVLSGAEVWNDHIKPAFQEYILPQYC